MAKKRLQAAKTNPSYDEKAAIVRVAQKRNPALFTTVNRSRLMSRVKQTNTAPEIAVRQLVHSLGFRFRVKGKGLPGTPDLINRKSRWAIFVHGCYWHAHEECHLWKIPSNNRPYWENKFAGNRERDRRKLEELKDHGYRALVVWQCELEDNHALTLRLLAFLEATATKGLSEKYRFIEGTKRAARTMIAGTRSSTTLQEVPFAPENGKDPRSAFDRAFLMGSNRVLPELLDPAIRIADLFCGCGGLSLGLREACWSVGRPILAALAVDHDPDALKVYTSNFSPLQSSGEDLEILLDRDLGSLPSAREQCLLGKIGHIEILVAGPPCQGHSDLNNQTRRKDPRNQLYEKVGRFVELAQPTHVLIENVPGVVHDSKNVLSRTAGHLESLGYDVDVAVVDLSQLGVPQRRKRHILVASLTGPICIASVLKKHEVPLRSVEWAISDLESRSAEGLFDMASNSSKENLERMHYLIRNNEYNLPNSLRPICHRNDVHSYKSMYGRLSWTEPAQTITSGFGSPGQGRFIHPSQARVLTPREAARLQFFPDSFSFSAIQKRGPLAQLIGNAVPMKLSWVFGLEFLATCSLDKSETTS
jgi:DNA (cytosine-5)-methyltransferase 1